MQAQIDLEWVAQIIKCHPNIAIEEIARKMRCRVSQAQNMVMKLVEKGVVLCEIMSSRLVYSLVESSKLSSI